MRILQKQYLPSRKNHAVWTFVNSLDSIWLGAVKVQYYKLVSEQINKKPTMILVLYVFA